jgi:hypothetical protein
MENTDDLSRLRQIHQQVGGTGPGRRRLEVLNKSAVVLAVACWEAFVEDLAVLTFDLLLAGARDHSVFPARVLTLAAKPLREHTDARQVWALADAGWRQVLKRYRDEVMKRLVRPFNTPRAANVDALFQDLVGSELSSTWRWTGMSSTAARTKLDALVTLRGQIAHRVAASRPVRWSYVDDRVTFLVHLAIVSSNRMGALIGERTGAIPWEESEFTMPSRLTRR